MKPGLYLDLSNSDYHSGPGYSSSDIIAMGESFAYWSWKKRQIRSYSADLTIGSVTHLMLEARIKKAPHMVAEGIAIYGGKGKHESVGFKEFLEENKGLYCLLPDDLDLCQRMIEKVFSEPEVVALFSKGICEASIYEFYPGTDVLMKTRPDYLRVEDGLSVNFKTMRDVSERGWLQAVQDGAYDWQSGIYLDLLGAHFGRTFDEIHVCVEKTKEGPINLELYTIPDDALAFARSQYKQVIERIPGCELTGIWPQSRPFLKSPQIPMYRQKVVSL